MVAQLEKGAMVEEKQPSRLNLGAGEGELDLPGFVNIDIKRGGSAYPLKEQPESVDVIRASHILEHYSHRQVPQVLKHWVNRLVPGGRLEIAVPDFKWIAENYVLNKPCNVQGFVMGGQCDEHDFHKSVFDRDSLMMVMADAGLERISEWESTIQDCASLEVSLNLAGYKPISDVAHDPTKVEAILSAPRYGPTSHWQRSAAELHNAGIRYSIGQGAYWHQVLSEGIRKLAPNTEFILTTDYDSIFKREDVTEILRLMHAYPEVDALFPLEFKRGESQFLGANDELIHAAQMNNNVLEMKSGHFGLTCFRAKIFQDLKKPWLQGTPNENGDWTDGKIDPDIYFWKNWREAGYSIFMAPKVRIGHLQEVVVWPGNDLQPVFQLPGDYYQFGPPSKALK